jgi:hypothetical protein
MLSKADQKYADDWVRENSVVLPVDEFANKVRQAFKRHQELYWYIYSYQQDRGVTWQEAKTAIEKMLTEDGS